MNTALSEQEIFRRQSLQALIDLGIDPYPAAQYDVNAYAQDILDHYEQDKINYKNISMAGRIMSRRIMGGVSFF